MPIDLLAGGAALASLPGQFGLDIFGSGPDVWRLKMLDPPETEFIGQYIAENVTENISARISNDSSLNKDDPNKSYLGGAGDTITFNARIYANNTVKNVKTEIDQLRKFSKRKDELKRAPIFRLQIGTDFAVICFVRSPGGIVYDRPRRDNGAMRGATFKMVVEVIDSLPTKEEGMSLISIVKTGLGIVGAAAGIGATLGLINVPGGSLHRKGRRFVTKQNQTFEEAAKLEYGNALSGDILRRVYYQQPLSQIKLALEIGDMIDLVDPTDLSGIEVTPQSEFLKDTLVNRQVITDHFTLRGQTKTIFV